MRNAHKTFEGALHIVTKARAADAGVKLVIGGHEARTNCKVIHIPALPLGDPVARVKALGYTAHESAHCRYTDLSVMNPDRLTPFEVDLANAMEDPRVDRIHGDQYPGLRTDRNALLAMYLADGTLSLREDATLQRNLGMYVSLRLQQLHNGQKMLSDAAEKYAAWVSERIPKAAFIRLEASLAQAMAAKSTADVVGLAKRISVLLKEEAEKAKQEPQKSDGDGESQQPQDQGGGSNDSSGDGQGTGSGDSNGQGNADGGDADAQPGQDGAAGSTDASTGRMADAGKGASNDAAKADALLAALGSATSEYAGIGETAARDLEEIARNTPYSEGVGDFSVVRSDRVDGNAQLVEEVRAETQALRRRISALIQTRAMQTTSIRNKGRRLSIPHLSRVKIGDDRIYRKISEGEGVSTAMSILIDGSTSMSGSQYELAKHAAAAVSLALGTVQGAAVEVLKFPMTSGLGAEVLCPFDVPLRRVANTLAKSTASGGTPLAEAMLAAGSSLHRRQERRKLMLVLHDGKPSKEEACRKIVGDLESMGIEVYGLGIRCDTRNVFARSMILMSAAELPKTIFGLLEGKLFDEAA